MQISTQIGKNLIFLKMLKGVTIETIKKDTGLKSIGNYMTGKTLPPVTALIKLAKYFEVSLDDLVLSDMREEAKGKAIYISESEAEYKTLARKVLDMEKAISEVQEILRKPDRTNKAK